MHRHTRRLSFLAWLGGLVIMVLALGCAAGDSATEAPNGGGGSSGADSGSGGSSGGDASGTDGDAQGDVSIDQSKDVSSDGKDGAGGDANDGAADADDAEADAFTGCVSDLDCASSPLGQFCDDADGGTSTCVACVPWNDQCGQGEYCDDATKTCATGCKGDGDCVVATPSDGGTDAGADADGDAGTDGATDAEAGATIVCDVQTHQCVGCVVDDDCPAGTLCDSTSHACKPGCTTAHACAAGKDCCLSGATGTCHDLQADVDDCGACGTVCPSVANGKAGCSAGTCGVAACNSGYGDCDANPTNGCETNTATSNVNCGGCGNKCVPDHASGACVGGACTIATCSTGFADCDLDATNGCEVNTTNDAQHCGACTTVCQVGHGTPACVSSQCAVQGCDQGYADCDDQYANGCETNTNTNKQNCGYCGNSCTMSNANAVCQAGVCAVGSCNTPYQNCDKVSSNGCEVNTNTDTANCGACGNACTYAHANAQCTNGTCGMASCQAGFGNCDNNTANGCETNTKNDVNNCSACGVSCNLAHSTPQCTNGQCQILACTAPFEDCNSTDFDGCEINTSTDKLNCGGCGLKCDLQNANNACSSGACIISSCASGYGDCDGQPGNGCEIQTASDVQHCGSCTNSCKVTNGTPTCQSGACKIAQCQAGFADCNSTYSDGCETNLKTDNNNCGACGNSCGAANGAASCSNGTCNITSCTAGFADCDGKYSTGCETNLKTTTDCGVCGAACAPANATGTCSSGACGIQVCNVGWTDCDTNPLNGCEINTAADANHCGTCATSCSVTNGQPACASGSCKIATCNAGFADCDGKYTTGCEINTKSDVNNCGGCGNACSLPHAASYSCTAGACGVATCQPGWGDCNGIASDGCETNLRTLTDCGACGTACSTPNATATCASGACAVSSCSGGWSDCDSNASNGCEIHTDVDVNHCGSCSTVCTASGGATPACNVPVKGGCYVATCPVGYGDCDGNPANSCETKIADDIANCGGCGVTCTVANGTPKCTGSTCGILKCNDGWGDCDGNPANGCETNLHSNGNCGACGALCNPANATGSCSTGTCTVQACNGGYTDCDKNPANGCEVNTGSDKNNCGGCGTVCNSTNGTASCSQGSCAISCNVGFANCDNNPANGCEANTSADPANCGGCGIACDSTNGSATCSAGKCGIVCKPGWGDCNGSLADGCEAPLTTTTNCGACNAKCAPSNAVGTCATGTCAIASCTGTYADCDKNATTGCEIDLSSNPSHCGSCAGVCSLPNATAGCTLGLCTVASCVAPYQNCNGLPGDGCEINTNVDPNNCGGCGSGYKCNSTNGSATCSNATCGIACNSGFGNCDGLASTGCEVNLNSDATHCGSCATNCTSPAPTKATGEKCASGSCAITQCESGYFDDDGTFGNGCECQDDGVPKTCGGAKQLPTVAVGATATYPTATTFYNLADKNNSGGEWFQVTFATAGAGCGFHPNIKLLGSSAVALRVFTNCSGGTMACGASEPANSATGSLVNWNLTVNADCGQWKTNDPAPGGGAFITAPTVYYVQVYRLASTASCEPYQLQVSSN